MWGTLPKFLRGNLHEQGLEKDGPRHMHSKLRDMAGRRSFGISDSFCTSVAEMLVHNDV